jgi:hypothetical protein
MKRRKAEPIVKTSHGNAVVSMNGMMGRKAGALFSYEL